MRSDRPGSRRPARPGVLRSGEGEDEREIVIVAFFDPFVKSGTIHAAGYTEGTPEGEGPG